MLKLVMEFIINKKLLKNATKNIEKKKKNHYEEANECYFIPRGWTELSNLN